jgi:hypothetical protein
MKYTTHLKRSSSVASLAICAAMTLACASLQAQTNGVASSLAASDSATYAYANQLYANKSYPAAYGRFARLADVGHAPSAKMALAMLSDAPTVLNGNWSATLDQQKRWSQLAHTTQQAGLSAALSETGD